MSLKPIRRGRRHRSQAPRLEGGRWQTKTHKWPSWNPSTKQLKVLAIIFILVAGLFGADQIGKLVFPQNPPLINGDPFSTIWQSTDVNQFNVKNANISGNPSGVGGPTWINSGACRDGVTCLLSENSASGNGTAIAITKTSLGDLSVASSKTLAFNMTWIMCGNGCTQQSNQNVKFGYYLTVNSTVPKSPTYNPANDPNVLYLFQIQCTSSCATNPGAANANWQNKQYLLRTIGQNHTIASEDTGVCSGATGSCFNLDVLATSGTAQSATFFNVADTYLNFTGTTSGATCPNTLAGPGCSWMVIGNENQGVVYLAQSVFPWANLVTQQLYLGIYMQENPNFQMDFGTQTGSTGWMRGFVYSAGSTVPNIDTGGFFGPVIKGLINVGIWIVNGILQFVAFIGPSIISALTFLESLIRTGMNAIGNAVGLGNVGTDFFNILNSVVTFFSSGQFNNIFTNAPALFARLIDSLSIYFPWLPTALSVAASIGSLGINSIGFLLTIIGFAFTFVSGAFATYLIAFWFIYTGDDSLAGILGFIETTEYLLFGLGLKYLANLINFSLDVVTNLIGLIPKPLIQMVAHQFPRIPIVEVNARFVWPGGSMSEIRNGNMLAVACWVSGVLFLDMYETASPALPGSIGFLLPAALSALQPIAGFIPLLEIMTAFAWGAAFLMVPINWLNNAFDFGQIPLDSAVGTKISGGFGGVRLMKASKRFQGRLEKKIGERLQAKKEFEQRIAEGRGLERP